MTSPTLRSKAALTGALVIAGGVFTLGMGLFAEFGVNAIKGGELKSYLAGLIFGSIPLVGVVWIVGTIRQKRQGGLEWLELGWYLSKRMWYIGIGIIVAAAVLAGFSIP